MKELLLESGLTLSEIQAIMTGLQHGVNNIVIGEQEEPKKEDKKKS